MMEQSTDPRREQELNELLEKRATIQEWIAKLEEQRSTAPERILQRVRADYESRLAETVASLGAHVDGIRSQLERAQDSASTAEREHEETVDTLEEGRLRHAIGEMPSSDWEERQQQLVAAVEQAREREERTGREVERLRDLLARLEVVERTRATTSPPATQAAAPAPEASTATPADGWEDPDATVESWEVAEAIGEGESEAFLAEIDRALSDGGEAPETSAPNDHPGPADEEADVDRAPKPGLKCGECGYTNDLSAWFCGVCGADIG